MSVENSKMEENLKEDDQDRNSIMNPINSFEMERQVEHLKIALSPTENEFQENDLNQEIKRSKIESNSKSNQELIIKTNENNKYFKSDPEAEKIINSEENPKPKNNKEHISKKFKNKVNELEHFIEKSKNNEIEILKIDHSKSRSKSKDYSNDKERGKEYPPLSQKYKKTNMKAAFGKLLNEKNLISELRKNFLKSLTKLNDHDTKEIAFSELKDLIKNFCTPEALRIYLNSLSTNYTTCTLAAKEIQAVLIGFIASVFQDNLLDSLDKPPSILKTVARMCDILLNYLKLNSNVIHKACSYSFQKLYKYSMPKDDQNAIILIFIDPLLPLVSSAANKMSQLGGAIVLSDLIVNFGKENKDILIKCHTKLINSLCKTKVENQFLVQALAELIRYLDIDYFMFYLKEIYERLINVLNDPKSNYCSRINSLECFKLIAKKLKNIDDEILGYHLTEIIFTLQNACKDRVHKVQLAANSAIRDWRDIEEIYEKNKKKGRYDKHKNISDKETNFFKIQQENYIQGDNHYKENYENENKNKEILYNYKQGKMNKLNVLRNLSKLNKQDSNYSNKINTEEDDFFKQRRNNRNINEFFKMDEIKDKNNFKKSEDNFKEETYKKGIGNVLKLSNLLKNFQKENKNNILNDLRSKSNPRAFNKISPPKNKLLESVANYLKVSRSGEKIKNENLNLYNNFDLNRERKFEKGLITDLNFYKKEKSPEFNKQMNLSEEELLDYQFLSDGEFQDKNNKENFVFENEAEKNIENYENTKKQNKIQDNVNLKVNGNNKFKENDYKEIREKISYDNRDNKNQNKDLLAMKTDINNIFISFMNNLETFNNNVNNKLNVLESKIKKNKKIIKKLVKEKKSEKLAEKEKSKQENSTSKGKKNESISKKEDNKSDELDKNSKKSERKNELDSKAFSKEMNNESNKFINNNNSKSFKNKVLDGLSQKVENKEDSKLIEQAELIEKLKKEVEFYQKNSQQEIFKNINYTVFENPNQKEHSSIKFWKEILAFIDQKDFNSAFTNVLESEDDLYLLRLLCITGPVLNCLKLDVCKRLIMRANLIYRSHQIEYLLLDLINNSHQHYIFNLLKKNEQNEILETLFQISGIKTIIGNIAADLYENITTNNYR